MVMTEPTAAGGPVYKMVSFRPPDDVSAELESRASSIGTAAKVAVVRYFAILAASRRAFQFSRDEAVSVVRALRDFDLTDQTLDLIPARLEVQFERRGVEGTINQKELIARVRRFTTPQKIALIDAIERYWREPPEAADEVEPRLRTVGLMA